MEIIRRIVDMQAQANAWRAAGKRIALVPTMGCLHAGHRSLIHRAQELADVVVVSIFVNPTQFGPGEDLAAYPRTWDADRDACEQDGVDVVFFPTAAEMYPADASTWVTEEVLSRPLCGARRPGHFRGVTTVVTKLFLATLPDVAVFGQKDAQQALVIKRLVRDLNFPVAIEVAPIVREPDGLALSSRNRYLSPAERERALALSRGIRKAAAAFAAGERRAADLIRQVRDEVTAADGDIDYIEIRDAATLEPVETIADPVLLAAAVRYGPARLIDNAILE